MNLCEHGYGPQCAACAAEEQANLRDALIAVERRLSNDLSRALYRNDPTEASGDPTEPPTVDRFFGVRRDVGVRTEAPPEALAKAIWEESQNVHHACRDALAAMTHRANELSDMAGELAASLKHAQNRVGELTLELERAKAKR